MPHGDRVSSVVLRLAPGTVSSQVRGTLVRLGEVDRGGTSVLLLLDLEGDLLAFAQAPQSSLLNGTDMHENVLPARVRGDEAVAFGRIEPFDRALGHRRVAFLPVGGSASASLETAAQLYRS